MQKLTRLLISGGIALFSIAAPLVRTTPVLAHEGEAHATEQPGEAPKPAAYDYETPKGGSLTLLARRSLQLYDKENESLQLTEAGVIYAETNIVNKIGRKPLETGERVSINKSDVEEFAKKSVELSPGLLARWEKYAKRANFNLNHINPTSQEQAGKPSDTSSTKTEQSQDAQEQARHEEEAEKQQGGGETTRTPWYWWVVGGATIAILYYLLSGEKTRR